MHQAASATGRPSRFDWNQVFLTIAVLSLFVPTLESVAGQGLTGQVSGTIEDGGVCSSAEYGRSVGGTIYTVTRSGTKDFHGGASRPLDELVYELGKARAGETLL